jgi:heme/copper-type cytochrome/quinol oxidase subunit 2
MERRSDGLVYYALVIAVVALGVSVLAYRGRARSLTPPPRPPATLRLSVVVATFSGPGMAAHRWYPTMLVARLGDTVDLTLGNPDRFNHQFAIPELGMRSRLLKPGSTDRLTFVADRAGVFLYQCVLPHDPARGNCTPDHEEMRGYLVVAD